MASLKKVFLLFTMLIMTLAIMAQNNVITFQAVVRDANNRLVPNEAITVTIQVQNIGGDVLYEETDAVTSTANGLISTLIGDNNPTEFAAVNWNDAKIKTIVKVVSSGYEVESVLPVNAVPVAIYSSDVSPAGSTITAVYNKMQQDSLVLAQRITADSMALHKATKDSAAAISAALADTASAIRNSIGDGLLTITYGSESPVTFSANQKTDANIAIPSQISANNGKITITRSGESIPNGEFTLNQSDDQTIDIEVPTKLSDLPNAGGVYAKRDSVNVFTAANDFTGGRAKVPSQFDINNPPTTCTQDAITICNLVAVFDSLTKRIDSISQAIEAARQEIEAMKTLLVTTDSIPVSTIAANTAKAYGTVVFDGGKPDTKRGMLYSTSDLNLKLNATGVDSVKATGTGKGSYDCILKQLVPCTQYYVRAFAYNDVDTAYGDVMNFTTKPFTCGNTLYDIDGNDYATLLLGSQCWMKQNLRVSHYANGDTILLSTSTVGTTSPYRYEPDSNLTTYGYLYNWYAAMGGSSSSASNPSNVQGVCPDGWHLPSDAEWTQLTDFVSSYGNGVYVCGNDPANIGKSMVSQQGWPESGVGCNIGNTVATNNSTQFSIPSAGTWDCGGGVGTNGVGYSNNGHAIFLSATENDDPTYSVYCREFYYMESIAEKTAPHKTFGRSVRCVLDCATGHTYLPTVSAVSLAHTSGTTVSMAASVDADGGAEVTARGVCWSTSQHPTTSSDHTADSGTGTGEFTVTGSLTAGTTYYIRAYATNSEGTSYGAEVTYVMPNPTYPPTVNTGSKFLALTEGFEGSTLPSTWTTIDHDGDGYTWYRSSNNPHNNSSGCATSDSYHFIDDNTSPWLSPNNYLISPDITIPSDISPNLTFWYSGYNEHFLVKVGSAGASSVGDFNTQVFGATTSNTGSYSQATVDLSSYAGQTFRLAFVHNGYYGNYQLYIDDIEVGEAGAIVSDITATTALCGGYVSDDGGATVTARGVCWSTSQNPTISDSHTTDGTGTGGFTSNITGLDPLTTYYVRAYATNSAGTSYGSQVSFTTTEALAKVTTNVVSDVTIDNTNINATCGGNVTDIGAYDVTARGVCWGTSTNPTISDSHTTDGSGLGSFTSNITGLTAGATYYVRAYATNSAGTAYGNQVSFTLPVIDTKSCSSAPVVTDHEGNMYATVQIGTLCWMRENLRTTTSPKTGTKLLLPARNSVGNVYSSPGSKVAHWPDTYLTDNAPKEYGLLYNWCAAMDTANPTSYVEVPTPSNIYGNSNSFNLGVTDPYRGICPAGWHIPSLTELNSIIGNYTGGKLAGGNDWSDNSSTATDNTTPGNYSYGDRNVSGFTALPAGFFNNYNYQNDGWEAEFWSTWQMDGGASARTMKLYYTSNAPSIVTHEKQKGMSVRCVKD